MLVTDWTGADRGHRSAVEVEVEVEGGGGGVRTRQGRAGTVPESLIRSENFHHEFVETRT